MRYLSVCSGIEAATVAWHPLGWKAAAYSEIEKFPSQVLAHHYPDVPNVGDMTKFKEWNLGSIDLLVGGTPCQSFSVAGLRKGLDDPRGNLMLTFLAIADQHRPRWLVWENVPGVLSSNGGKDFGTFLGALGELGYGFAYRVLDAQYFGVAQRRRRVFVVGHIGDWRAAAAVLFERHSLSGDSAPSREKRKEVASGSGDGAQVGNLIGLQDCKHFDSEISGTIVTREGCVSDTSHMLMQSQPIATHGLGFGGECARALTASHSATGRLDPHESTYVSQPIPFDTTQITSKANYSKPESGDPCHPLAAGAHPPAIAQPISFSGQMSEPQTNVDMTQTLQAKNPMAVAVGTDLYNGAITGEVAVPMTNRSDGTGTGPTVMQPICLMDQGGSVMNIEHDMSGTLRRETHGHEPIVMQSVAFEPGKMKRLGYGDAELGLSPTLRASAGDNQVAASVGMAVRRLTPVECERLQGFPDNYTDIQPKGKATPDGPRYKALGNSMAVPVMAWIGKRIQEVEQMQCKPNR